MSALKLKIMVRACRIRLESGETLDEILESYPALTEADKSQLVKAIGNE